MEDDHGFEAHFYQNDQPGPSRRRNRRRPNRSTSSHGNEGRLNLPRHLSASQTPVVHNQQDWRNVGAPGQHHQNRPRNNQDSGWFGNRSSSQSPPRKKCKGRQPPSTSTLRGQLRANGNRGSGRSVSYNRLENARFSNSGPNRNEFRQDRRNNENRNDNRSQNQSNSKKIMGFKILEEIARIDSRNIFLQINDKKEYFLNLLNCPDKTPDTFVLIIELLAKVSSSSYDQLKSNLLVETCSSQFINHLGNYLLNLPFANRLNNKFYWANERDFWGNLISLCECIVNMLPSIALQKCRPLIEATTRASLDLLKEQHQFQLPEELSLKITSLRERLHTIENKNKMESEQRQHNRNNLIDHEEPPDDFRQLNILPDRDDLLIDRPFFRPNIVNGAYRDVEHYLDVQFRLLREDCFGPLRQGLHQYINDPARKRFDHIRVFHNVKFLEPYVTQNKMGSMIQIDEKTLRRFKRINWAHSKRFLFGSLLLLTKDNCVSFVIATILDRDVKNLSAGKIPVSIINHDDANMGDDLYNNDSYTLIESEVYFEPYLHVLKALRDPLFPEHLAMSKYIVHVDTFLQYPAYIEHNNAVFQIKLVNNETAKFTVLQQETWPNRHAMGLNESQYEAYKLALTHEFAVIQGPPGTGKTFLGVKIAETLLRNLSLNNKCLMLVICYTNHALDQFLEAILPFSKSMVRIGGQSRNKTMEKININNLRRDSPHFKRNRLFFEQKHQLKMSLNELRRVQKLLESLNNGVLSYNSIRPHVPEIEIIKEFYSGSGKDPLKQWLFVGRRDDFTFEEFTNILREHLEDEEIEVPHILDDDIYERNEVILEDFQDVDLEIDVLETTTSFSINEAETELKRIISCYKLCDNQAERVKLESKIKYLKSHISLYKEMKTHAIHHQMRENHIDIRNVADISRIPTANRWILYFNWANVVMQKIKQELKPLQESLYSANEAYEEARMMMDVEIIKHMEVVGMTTSGAARMRKLLQALAPPIVIVEEAAEVLEAHIVTSLNKQCQHLILIGDHQQLRPSAAHMKLARDYNLEVSLFERMIVNNIHSRRLAVQHRMRPEIAALISPHIYPDLENHPSVRDFPNVLGVMKNLFFLTHKYKEQEMDDNVSRTNHIEADMTLKLANYLMQQGYNAEDITVLAAYSGQMFYMRKQRENYAYLREVKITVVDNYQGEESKIILLSLVRNNNENNIGFLGTDNRVCVALSRAKEGFYIFGNIDLLQRKSELWKKIATTLQNNGSLGTSLNLKCENHLNQITPISSPKDFDKVPEGGCLLKCNYNLPCGHACPLICHGYDRQHAKTRCFLPCEKVICDLEHVCPLKCYMKCQPCNQRVQKTLPCGHKKLMPCHRSPDDPAIKCLTIVPVTLPDCQHETTKNCYLNINDVVCQVRCEYRVDSCGHECRRKCHVNDDPDHENYVCLKPCAKAKKGCSAALSGDRGEHQCKKTCHEACDDCEVLVMKKRSTCKHSDRVVCCANVDETQCRKNCARTLPCGHFCKKKCFEACGNCTAKTKKIIESCGHEIEIECSKEATRELCRRKCERILSCGHQCPDRCDKVCDPAKCNKLISREFPSPCGHTVKLPCNVFETIAKGNPLRPEMLLKNCMAPCERELECGHFCSGTCAQCLQGRLHVPCTQTCHQNNICGHRCEEPCNQVCPPCKKPCEVRCPHSRCRNPCGAPCRPCQEKCSRKCRHGECSRRCSEPCDREPCNIPCNKRLRCGHACRGLCGEPCPDICKLCRPDDFPTTFLGDDFDDDDKFVLLKDCNHILALEDMDNLMTGDTETVSIRQCPFCRKPIVNTYRYKDLVNDMFTTEINPIKLKVYGTPSEINEKEAELKIKVKQFIEIHRLISEGSPHWKKAYLRIANVIRQQKKVSLLQLEMQSIYLNILDMLGDNYNKYFESNLKELKDEFLNQIMIICETLASNTQKISQQQQKDIGNEIKRMTGIIQLSKLVSHNIYLSAKDHPKVIEASKEAKTAVLTWNIYNQNDAFVALKKLQDGVKIAGIVTKEERDLVVKAMGFKAGHWYKCPNGHFYCIGECGGAMQIAKCIECGADVGGQSHSLLSDNRHAGELDGSRFAAWSEEYNNMANFNLDNIH